MLESAGDSATKQFRALVSFESRATKQLGALYKSPRVSRRLLGEVMGGLRAWACWGSVISRVQQLLNVLAVKLAVFQEGFGEVGDLGPVVPRDLYGKIV